jgi:hypothetical protein
MSQPNPPADKDALQPDDQSMTKAQGDIAPPEVPHRPIGQAAGQRQPPVDESAADQRGQATPPEPETAPERPPKPQQP